MIVEEDILFYAFRYALGRMTYAVSDVVHSLKANWSELTPHTRKLIIKEIVQKENLGMDCDKEQWLSILKWDKEKYSLQELNEGAKNDK